MIKLNAGINFLFRMGEIRFKTTMASSVHSWKWTYISGYTFVLICLQVKIYTGIIKTTPIAHDN